MSQMRKKIALEQSLCHMRKFIFIFSLAHRKKETHQLESQATLNYTFRDHANLPFTLADMRAVISESQYMHMKSSF